MRVGDGVTLQRPRRRTGGRRPSVTAVVPCYNYGRFLPQCVRSILDQPGVDVRVHVLDDCSTDDSLAVARALAAADSRVRVTAHRKNQGHIATYNEGLAQVETDYLVLISADDALAPGALARATGLMEANPEVGMAYGHPLTFTEVVVPSSRRIETWSTWTGPRWVEAQFRRGLSIVYSPEAVVRTEVQHRVGGYDPALPVSGDLEMWLRIAAVASVGRVNGPDQAYRRVHAESMMHTGESPVVRDLRERVRAYESFIALVERRGIPGLDPVALRETYRRRLAAETLLWARRELALTGAAPGSTEIQRALAFLAEVHPAHRDLPEWSTYAAVAHGGPEAVRALGHRMRVVLAEKTESVRWRRWRELGF